MKILAIIGSGELGQQIANFAINDNHYKEIVFFDDFTEEKVVNGYPVLGKSNQVKSEYEKDSFDELIIAIGYKHIAARKSFFERFKGIIPFGSVVHSTSHVDSTARLGEGIVVYPMCIIDANVEVKDNVLLNIGTSIAHDTVIQQHCFLSPRVAIAGFVKVGECTILGINCTIIDNIEIIKNTQIGAGAVVIKDIVESGLYVGNPVRYIRANDSI